MRRAFLWLVKSDYLTHPRELLSFLDKFSCIWVEFCEKILFLSDRSSLVLIAMRSFFVVFLILIFPFSVKAEQDSSRVQFNLSGYLETYYGFDFSQPSDHQRPDFMYSHHRHNEFALNLGLVRANVTTDRVRANLGFMLGTYAQRNLAHEAPIFRNLFEANIGLLLSTSHDIWVEAGVFPSHIGFESAIGQDCWTLSRSILADNSPYYEAGGKVSYSSKNKKWYLAGLMLNGWQRMQRLPGNQTPAFGHQVTWKPTPSIVVNSSSFIGNEFPDSLSRMRYFHNFYAQWTANDVWGVILGYDIGAEQKSHDVSAYSIWHAPVVMIRYRPQKGRFSCTLRGESYQDKGSVMISSEGASLSGGSLTVDYHVTKNMIWRQEGRLIRSKMPLGSTTNFWLGSAMTFSF